MKTRLEEDKKDTAQSVSAFVQQTRDQVSMINQKLQRLLDGYLDQLIDQETYKSEKNKLTSSKKSLEENLITLERTQIGWIVSSPYEEIGERTKITPESQQRLDWNSSVMSTRVSTVRASGFLRY